jgi:hypothetical protein
VTHDAQKVLTDLRDHLARHDKPLAFLFGAGTSCAVRIQKTGATSKTSIIPAVAGLTDLCKVAVDAEGDKFKAAWNAVAGQIIADGRDPHIENILSQLRMMLRAVGGGDTLCGLNKGELEKVEEVVRQTIAKAVNPDCSGLPVDVPHRRFAQWLGRTARKHPVEIFTLNYDVLIEHCLEIERVPVFDGFVGCYQPFFHGDSLRRPETAPGANWARLWKMHGSITWRKIEQEGRPRVVRGDPDPSGAMIYPSFDKYDESRQQPYSAFAERLVRFLEQDDALLVTAGFSFGDEHINNLIFGALENRPRTHVYALQFGEAPDDNDLVRRARTRPNLILLGPESGVLSGTRAEWNPVDPPAFMTDAFEVITVPGTAGAPDVKRGRMKIGDFGAFAQFLAAMGGA